MVKFSEFQLLSRMVDMADLERGDSAVVANAKMLDKAAGVRVYVTGSWARGLVGSC